jgi:hypothetical protein
MTDGQKDGSTEAEAADWYGRLNATVVDNGDLVRSQVWR